MQAEAAPPYGSSLADESDMMDIVRCLLGLQSAAHAHHQPSIITAVLPYTHVPVAVAAFNRRYAGPGVIVFSWKTDVHLRTSSLMSGRIAGSRDSICSTVSL
jgi:hypothetical protein